jgi:hypothetical protein
MFCIRVRPPLLDNLCVLSCYVSVYVIAHVIVHVFSTQIRPPCDSQHLFCFTNTINIIITITIQTGATANAVSAIFSHYPWFYTYRVLSHSSFLPNLIKSTVLRNALIGFISSVISDTFANSIRVVKTAKQAIGSKQTVSYKEVIAMILAVDGLKGLFGRGLRTRIFGNALQSVLFTVIWRGLAERKNASQNESLSRRSLEEVKSDESFNDNIKIEENDVPLEEERF